MSPREAILQQIHIVAIEQRKILAPLTDDLPLQDSGLDSLCLAILVSRLEDITGRDPLSSSHSGRFPHTIGDFIALYEDALA